MTLPSNKTVSIVVVTAGAHSYLPKCLASLSQQTYAPYEVLLLDNSDEGRPVNEAARSFPYVKVYRSGSNLLYGQALNKGIESSNGEFILCLNDDVVLDAHFIEEAMGGFKIDERIGLVSGKLLRFDKETLDSTGLFLSPWRTARERGYGRKDRGQFQRGGDVFGVSGAAAFYRRSMLEDVRQGQEYFDTDFGMFYEDLDIAWRARRRLWRGYYVPEAIAYHARGASVRCAACAGQPLARRFLSGQWHAALIRNRYLTMIKNETTAGFIIHLPFIFCYDVIQWLYLFFIRSRHARSLMGDSARYARAIRKRRDFFAAP